MTMLPQNGPTFSPLSWIPESTTRSVYDIISTCVSTMLICVWSAVHLDVPTRRRGFIRETGVKLGWMAIGLLMPDLMLFVAICQGITAVVLLRQAYRLLDDMPPPRGWFCRHVLLSGISLASLRVKHMSRSANDGHPEKASEASLCTESPARKYPWSLSHAYYAAMGGFVVDTDIPISIFGEHTRFTLTARGINWIMEHAPHLIPDIRQESLEDRSKADSISKALLMWQMLYFCVSCALRRSRSLPLTLLEVTTLAHALCTLLTYTVWWKKPLDVMEPTVITDVGKRGEVREIAAYLLMSSSTHIELPGGLPLLKCPDEFHFLHRQPHPKATPIPENTSDDSRSSSPTLYDHNTKVSMSGFLPKRRRTRCGWLHRLVFGYLPPPWYTHPCSDAATLQDKDIIRWSLAERTIERCNPSAPASTYPPFIQADSMLSSAPSFAYINVHYAVPLVITACTAVYGLPHIIGWHAQFTTKSEQTLWRAASVVLPLISVPHFTIVLLTLYPVYQAYPQTLSKRSSIIYGVVAFLLYVPVSLCIYALSGGFLITESIRQLSHLPPAAFDKPALLNFWPHLY